MEVIKSSSFAELKIGPVVIALGTFDGLHLGHQAIIKEAINKARELSLPSGVYTFQPHPLKVLKPALAPRSLISNRQKIELLTALGVDYYFEQKFTPEFSQLEYQDFVKEILLKNLHAAYIIVGEDFHFGRRGKGNVDSLLKLAKEYGFTVQGLKTVTAKKQKISSTLLRKLVEKGQIKDIPEYLGRHYRLDGRVIHGEGRGRKLGVPTANLQLATDYVLPPHGVYACKVIYQGKRYLGVTSFGVKPTFQGKDYSIEVHILDFSIPDIYGENLSIELIDFIRPEMTFNSAAELLAQIDKDILYTKSLLC